MHVVIIGSGAWGTTLSGLVHLAGSQASLVARNEAVYRSLAENRRHPFSIQEFHLPDDVEVVQDPEAALASNPDLVIVVVPSAAIGAVGELLASIPFDGPVLTATKGIDPERLLTSSEHLAEHLGGSDRIAALSGPNLAKEIAVGQPAAAVIASESETVSGLARDALMSSRFRIYTSSDITGVEIAGALKNVIAIGAGIADGLGAGQNAKAAFMTRGIAEMARLGIACGATPMTFAGLAGIGDLMATCNSESSRNHSVGRALAEGKSIEQILAGMHEVAEGVPTTRAALALGKVRSVELPIATQIARVMFEGVSPRAAITELMARDATGELNM